jgi:hypothetical protein
VPELGSQAGRLAACLVAGIALLGCKIERQARVEDIWVAQAAGLITPPKGKTLPIIRGTTIKTLPETPYVRLAIARDVEWSEVRALRKQILDAGKTPYFIVADDRKVGALALYEELQGEAIDVFVSVGGKLCVAPPNSPEAKCVQRGDKLHVDRAFTRELVREAVGAYGLHDVLVKIPPDIEWGDVARAVDGARTCCLLDDRKDNDVIRVRLK